MSIKKEPSAKEAFISVLIAFAIAGVISLLIINCAIIQK